MAKASPLPRPRPPDTTTRAAVSSGRSLSDNSRPTKRARPGSAAASIAETVALPPWPAAAGNAVVRTVTTLIASLDRTVAMALPA